MGNWTLVIHGVGAHHNGKPDVDADAMADAFVSRLVNAGQRVEEASFTSGGRLTLPTSTEPSEAAWERSMRALEADNASLVRALRKVVDRGGPLAETAHQFLRRYHLE